MESINRDNALLFSAVSSSARQLFQLLRCINFASKAEVQISEAGLRFTAEDSRVMQGWYLRSVSLKIATYVGRRRLSRKFIVHDVYVPCKYRQFSE